ncbi:MAG: hypothetical protein QM723_40165 [Myxococcaceae bacterium]
MIHAALLALALTAGPTVTVKGKVTVHKSDGAELPDASDVVVYVEDVNEPVKGATAVLKQQGRQFVPRVLVVAQGTEVKFPNEDSMKHNVFTNSPNVTFDLGEYAKNEGKSRVFEKPGEADMYCNIHSEMIAYVVVAPSKLFAITGKDGSFEIKGVPVGKHRLRVWERFARPKEKKIEIDAAEGAAPLAISVDELAAADDAHKNKHGQEYKPDPAYH